MLYIIDQFPLDTNTLQQTASGDTVLFTENAVLAVRRNTEIEKFIKKTLAHINLCVSGTDLALRGLAISDLLCGVSILDERDLIDIAGNDPAIRSWN